MKTLIRFKLFKIKLGKGKIKFDPTFDKSMWEEVLRQEQEILKSNKPCKLIRIIPDELPLYFWGARPGKAAKTYVENFKKWDKASEFVLFSELLKNKQLKKLYDQIFEEVYSSFDADNSSNFIDPEMFELEVVKRSTYYTKRPLSRKASVKLAKKAFALFAAETTIIRRIFANPYLITKGEKVDVHKYDFYTFPKNVPALPKLFVI